jgi:hypothetical protein
VTGVEVFIPSPLLAEGLCLVDTPGLASVSEANAAAAWGFVPHVDAALVVLGADPPISGAELALVAAVASAVADVIFVLNKGDRLPDPDREEVVRFTERTLSGRLGRPVGPILQVSAAERRRGVGPARDWDALVGRLQMLGRTRGAELVRAAEAREARALLDRLLGELEQQQTALTRPIEESEARAERLRRAAADAERALEELGPRLAPVQERLARALTDARQGFLRQAVAEARRNLHDRLEAMHRQSGTLDRARAVEAATEVARTLLDRWRREQGPQIEELYRQATERAVSGLAEVYDALAAAHDLRGLARPRVESALTARSGLVYTEMLRVAPVSAPVRLLDRLRPRSARQWAVERDAAAYLERLLEVNSARVANDFLERAARSRLALEAALRRHLHDAVTVAERAVEQARQARAAGAAAVHRRLAEIAAWRARAEALRRRRA